MSFYFGDSTTKFSDVSTCAPEGARLGQTCFQTAQNLEQEIRSAIAGDLGTGSEFPPQCYRLVRQYLAAWQEKSSLCSGSAKRESANRGA